LVVVQEEDIDLLVVEDDPGLQRQLRWSFEGCEVSVASDFNSALGELERHASAVVTLDLGLPPDPGGTSEGFRLLDEILKRFPDTKVIVVTGHNDRDNAVRAIGRGAYDFFEKPIDPDLLSMTVQRAAKLARLERDYRKLATTTPQAPFSDLIAVSPQMLEVCRNIEKLAPTDVTTLILGESGTGKEVLVRALHSLSARASRRLVAINCAAIPDTLLESELFGYEKGAFTGAVKTTRGKIETADRGILFLDEIGDLPHPLQAKLLRFLQERVIERIGGRQEIPVDVRVICATHQDIPKLILAGQFREDLYYRINEATIYVPPLRDRQDDAVVLARAFLKRFAAQHRKRVKSFSPEAMNLIESYGWPGNVRELENRVKRAVVMADSREITPQDLELADVEVEEQPLNLREVRELTERSTIQRALHRSDGNLSRASELLGITRPTLYTMMRKHKIKT
jgi:two-component system NtrC family response regulator